MYYVMIEYILEFLNNIKYKNLNTILNIETTNKNENKIYLIFISRIIMFMDN